jgi:type I restriction enzyme S subunit
MNFKDVLVDNENKRIDSEYFKKQFLKFFKDVPNLRPLGSLAKDGYRVVYENTKIIDKEEALEHDFPVFLQATDLETPFIKTSNLFYVDNEQWERYPKGRITKGEILIEVKGKIDKVAIVPDDFPEKTLVTGSLFKLTVNEKISKHVLLTYLISKFGVAFKDRYKTNLLISFVSKPDLYRIPVPSFSKTFEGLIDNLFVIIIKSQKESKDLYNKAEYQLLDSIGLYGFEPSRDSVNIKTFQESFGITKRLDAEYYQKKYQDYEELIVSQKHTFIKREYRHITTTSKKDKVGYNYIEIGDVNVGDGSNKSNYVLTNELPANAKTLVEKGDILISNVRPYRGAVTIINKEEKDLIVSGAFTVLRKNPNSIFNNEVLKVLLRSPVYKDWLLKFNVGTSYPVIKDEDVLNMPIPFISADLQNQIAELVEESFKLKVESERLLKVAKKAVEIAIEADEATATKFIKDNY